MDEQRAEFEAWASHFFTRGELDRHGINGARPGEYRVLHIERMWGAWQAAALLRTQHAAIERKDALLRQAVELIGSFSAIDICETQHHKKADQHSPIGQCPVAERFRAVWFSIKQELSQ